MLVEMYKNDALGIWCFKTEDGAEWQTSLGTTVPLNPKEEKCEQSKTVFKLLDEGVKPKEIIALKEAGLL